MKEFLNKNWIILSILTAVFFCLAFLSTCSIPKNIIVPFDDLLSVEVYESKLQQDLESGYETYSLVHSFPYEIEDIAIDYPEKKALIILGRERYNPSTNQGLLLYYDLVEKKIL